MNLADNTADTHREESTLPCEQTFNNIDKILNLNSCEDEELQKPSLFAAALMQKRSFL